MAETLTLWFILISPTYQVPFWSALFSNQDILAPLTMVQIHPTLTWYSGIPPPPRVDRLQLHLSRNSEQTPSTITLCLHRAAPSVSKYRGDFEQVGRYMSDSMKIVLKH